MAAPPTVQSTSFECVSCGYNLTGATIGGLCPECGLPIAQSLRRTSVLKSSGQATAALIIGILSLVMCIGLGPVAIALAYSAMVQIRRGGYTSGSKGMATAGLVMGGLSTLLLAGFITLAIMDVV